MGLTTAKANAVLDQLLGVASIGATATVYVAAYNGDPASTGVESETAGTDGYARVALTAAAASGGSSSNSVAINFGTNSGVGAWAITHYALMSAATAGTRLWSGALTNATVATNEDYEIAIGGLVFTVT